MILEIILNLIKGLFIFVFGLLPDLPDVPDSIQNVVSDYFNLITENLSFISFFLDVNYTKILISILLILISFELYYKFILWIYHKIPISSY